ncbi:MAG: Na/Pi cotransporter family protein [Planctomycetales bacterium]|nr:Na/Pi cotransporter family protein [Planctomycetales bacterium]
MKNMSEGMQTVAGSSLRKLINSVTTNRFLATTVGVIVTCLVQSSSITTVMVVGFVNSGLMELSQAIGVILGANIGTTITGWILVLKIGKYGLPLLGFGAFGYLFSKGDRWRYLSMVFLGIGMVFFGLELMKDACAIIKETPDFEVWFQRFQADNYFGVLQCALAGCILTMLVQSSSATLGITISLAFQGIISYETAAALVLGENIGTTITAILASLGATTGAKRAAYFHAIFNILGVLWITAIFGWYIGIVQSVVNVDVAQMVITADGKSTFPNTTPAIAATHTIFNVANTILFLPFVPAFARFLTWLVPPKKTVEKRQLTDLDIRILETPTLAIEQSRRELERMGESCAEMLGWLDTLLKEDDPDRSMGDNLQRTEKELDTVHDEVVAFVTNLLSTNVPHSIADEGRRQLRMADEYESVSDYIANLDTFDRKLRRDDHRFSAEQRAGLAKLNQQVADYLARVNQALLNDNRNIVVETDATSQRIKAQVKQLRRQHLQDISGGEITPQLTVAVLAALNAYMRVRDHISNIAEAITGEK